jgi:hypothetical protein
MKRSAITKIFASALIVTALFACERRTEEQKAEDRQQAGVGKIYNAAQQGPGHENWENQFFISRGKPVKGAQMAAAAAAGDTTAVKAAGDTITAKTPATPNAK